MTYRVRRRGSFTDVCMMGSRSYIPLTRKKPVKVKNSQRARRHHPDQASGRHQGGKMGPTQAPGPEGQDQGRRQRRSKVGPAHGAQYPQVEPLMVVRILSS